MLLYLTNILFHHGCVSFRPSEQSSQFLAFPRYCIERADGGLFACYCQIQRYGPETIRVYCAIVAFDGGVSVALSSREDHKKVCVL